MILLASKGTESRAGESKRSRKEAEHIINTVITSLETTLLNHLSTDGFTLKLNGFGKFYVRHKPGIRRFLSPLTIHRPAKIPTQIDA